MLAKIKLPRLMATLYKYIVTNKNYFDKSYFLVYIFIVKY